VKEIPHDQGLAARQREHVPDRRGSSGLLAESLNSYSTLHAIKEAVEKGIVEAVSAERAEGDHALASLRSQLTLAESDRDAFKAQLDAIPAAKVKSMRASW
jgi:hypothetical protein